MRGTARRTGVISFLLAIAASTGAWAGTITGSVKDGKTGEPLIGATVGVVNTKLGGSTDLDGRYSIADVPAGLHSLRVMYAGYALKVVTGVAVAGEQTTSMDIRLEPMTTEEGDAMRIEDIYVTAERLRTSATSILADRQRAAVIGDAISAEQIRLSPDGNSSDALRRVTGLSIVDDKFVFVRGVTDRYNATTLNGVSVTGTDTDSDKKSFNFDLMPASLIASTVVLKTATPDLPGDFSGGLVQVNTLDLPNDFLAAANIEGGYDNISSRADIKAAPGGGKDWTGQDDGSRALPSGLEGNALAQALPNTWGTAGDESRMNQTYGLAIGDRYQTGAGEFGFIASGTYKNNFKVEQFHQEPYGEGIDGTRSNTPLFVFDGTRYKHRYLWGGLLNLTYRPWGNHSFSAENNYTRSAEDKVVQSTGVVSDSTRYQTIEWDQRDLYLGQIAGDHVFPQFNQLEFDWRASYSNSDAQEPDRKFAEYSRDPRGNYLLGENLRSWSTLEEDTRSAQADVTYPIGDTDIKAGYLYLKRERSYEIDAYTTDASKLSRPNRILIIEPIDEIFAAENYGDGKFGFLPYSPLTGDYDGTQDLNTYYGMVDSPFRLAGQRFRFAGGARVEDSNQIVVSPTSAQDPTPQTAQIDETDVLPSANLTYQVTGTSNVRLGYFESVNRPEFREMANVAYIDFDANQGVIGNPDLKRALITNYDARLEWFPGPGEVLAVSYFYKEMTDAIEEQLLPSPDRYVRTWFNSPEGKNYGFEVEIRTNLGFAWRQLENFVVQGNYTRVDSEVEYTESYTDPLGNPITETKTRTMQGQAPYTVNAGLVYSIPDVGLSMSLLYNRFGRRLDAVGDTRDYDIFEESRDIVDFALTQQFYEWMRLKFTMKDLIGEDIVYTFGETGSVWESVKVGTTYAVSLSFSL
ncbi:MAG TPA: TonB-dependent receptor [Candidatus Krumholzibacteria bacterium]|nr:TonB-dependent receptor [Candidatus Krumholzibacteria bacterium]